MAMKVEIVSRQLIKPYSPSSATPQSGGYHKLSLLDQTAPHGYNPILLFYSTAFSSETYFTEIYDSLRVSLSETLSYVRPLAGRVKDEFTVDCNDEGVDLVLANVYEDMSFVLRHPKTAVLRQLLPVNPETKSTHSPKTGACGLAPPAPALVMVQVNRFACGGLAVGLCVSHVITDAMSMTSFLTTWAAINRRENGHPVAEGFAVVDCTSFFPPTDVKGFSLIPLNSPTLAARTSTRRLVFDASKIAALRERAATELHLRRRPSRVEAVSALVWEAAISAFQETNPAIKTHVMLSAADLRSKMQPPLPRESIGNIFQVAEATWGVEEQPTGGVDYYISVLMRVQESMQRAKESSFTPILSGEDFLKALKYGVDRIRNNDEIGLLMSSSICRFPVYEIDFGFGKPEWVGNGIRAMNVCIMGDTKNGDGIEAILGLSEEHMNIVEHNPNFLSYASFIQPL